MSHSRSTSKPLVLDFGTETTRAGFAGEDVPSLVFASTLGKPKYKKVLGPPVADEMVGPAANTRSLYTISQAVERGELLPAFQQKLLQRVWADLSLKSFDGEVFVTEPVFASTSAKLSLAQNLLEKGRAGSLFFGTQAILSLFGYGKTDGFVLEVGEGVTQLAPVFNGFRLSHALGKEKFGGQDVTSYFGSLLQRNGVLVDGDSDALLYSDMKKALLEALPAAGDLEGLATAKDARRKVSYELPDGEVLSLQRECFEAAELLFKPEVDGLHCPSLQELVVDSVRKLDVDLRKYMYKKIYLAGGTAMTVGFPERLANEIAGLVHERTSVAVIAPSVDKTLLAWQGASALCQLSTFSAQWITAKELAEAGERVFLAKAL